MPYIIFNIGTVGVKCAESCKNSVTVLDLFCDKFVYAAYLLCGGRNRLNDKMVGAGGFIHFFKLARRTLAVGADTVKIIGSGNGLFCNFFGINMTMCVYYIIFVNHFFFALLQVNVIIILLFLLCARLFCEKIAHAIAKAFSILYNQINILL